MDPKDIAKFITDDPDVIDEGRWEDELGIADPHLEDPVNETIKRARETCWRMLKDKMGGSADELMEIHTKIMSQLMELINKNIISYRDWQDIEQFIANEIETVLWNPPG
jgi:hypothetical protein